MDPVHRLQLVRALNSVRCSTEYGSSPASASTIHLSAKVELEATMVESTVVAETTGVWAIEHLMVELRIEDPAGFQNFVRCEPAMFHEMVDSLTP